MVASVHTIEQGLAWNVGDGSRVRLGRDPWVGCTARFTLSHDLLAFLNDRGFLNLNQVADHRITSIWRQGWLSGTDLHLEERWKEEWRLFCLDLQNSSVRITDSRDELRWVHVQSGSYSLKMGYKWLMSQQGWEAPAWWSKLLWKLKFPTKTKLFFWCILQKKVPTWDILQRRGKVGSGWCSLCKSNEESSLHIFLTCPFNVSLWAESLRLINSPLIWEGDSIHQAWTRWWQEVPDDKVRTIPLLIA